MVRKSVSQPIRKISPSTTSKPPAVKHDASTGTFSCGKSHLDYLLHAIELEMEIIHTYVPPRLRGRGQAAALCDAAYAYAHAEGLQVRPTCAYVLQVYEPRAAAARGQRS